MVISFLVQELGVVDDIGVFLELVELVYCDSDSTVLGQSLSELGQ
jgi:hypothetical protein